MNTIHSFWQHFLQNNFVFLLLDEIPTDALQGHFEALVAVLHQYNKDLDLIIKNKKNGAALILTANGNPYLFKQVALLVHHAPKIDHWTITALLQPEFNLEPYENGTDRPLDFYGIKLRISEMYFLPIIQEDQPCQIGIRVFLNSYLLYENNPKLQEAVYVQIEHLIGEKSFANDLLFIEIDQLSYDLDGLFHLYYLRDFLEDYQQQQKLQI